MDMKDDCLIVVILVWIQGLRTLCDLRFVSGSCLSRCICEGCTSTVFIVAVLHISSSVNADS